MLVCLLLSNAFDYLEYNSENIYKRTKRLFKADWSKFKVDYHFNFNRKINTNKYQTFLFNLI